MTTRSESCGPGMCRWSQYIDLLHRFNALSTALANAFPHFQDGRKITAEIIRQIGREYTDMVMGWAPVPTEIEFFDDVGEKHKLIMDGGAWCTEDDDVFDNLQCPLCNSKWRDHVCP